MIVCLGVDMFFFFKQKTAYEMRISDWSSDVCSSDLSFRLNQEYFDYCTGLKMTSKAFDRLFGGPPRKPEDPLTQREMDLAASVQKVTEEVVLRLARYARRTLGEPNLCLAGGVAPHRSEERR